MKWQTDVSASRNIFTIKEGSIWIKFLYKNSECFGGSK